MGASSGWCLKLMGVAREGVRVERQCLFDPIITSGIQDQIRSGGGGRTRTATPRNKRLAGLRIQTHNFEL